MAPTLARPATIKFSTPDGPVEKAVDHGDGLKYVGQFERGVCPAFRARVTFDRSKAPLEEGEKPRATHVLVGPPPDGCSDDDLLAAGVGTCVTVEMVGQVAGSGQWQHVPADDMAS